ncbi:MAG TPA: transcriptional repressor LexA [Gemmatimonadaceae bacterium]|jgi:repressor LexA|nr:transcriptional repressor LexA [Gemmatimonadaceae bacterium]
MPDPLTHIERKVYNYLLDFLSQNTYQPSVREIGRRFKIKSTKTVSELLQSLAKKGYIERDPSRSRGVRLLGYQTSRRIQPVPYYGKIAAGEPMLLPENRQGFITMDRRFVPSENVFFFRVKGDSMIGRGIFDGDYVLVQPRAEVREGTLVAARVGDGATVKTIKRMDGEVVLEAANPAERDITIRPGDDFSIIGPVCGVFRPFQETQEAEVEVGED